MSELSVDPAHVRLSMGGSSREGLDSISEENEMDEMRRAEATTNFQGQSAAGSTVALQAQLKKVEGSAKENRWKLAFRQLVFMKRMNMQFNDRAKNEIELRQQNITVGKHSCISCWELANQHLRTFICTCELF